MEKILVTLKVNEEYFEIWTYPNRTLLEVLREDLSLTGAKESCGQGVCGACTVLMNGAPVRSCITLAMEAEGATIETVEGLSKGGILSPVQEAFVEHHAIQCGFCSPGMIMTATAFLRRHSQPSAEEIRRAISGNVCRCTGYAKIVEAIGAAASKKGV